MTDPSSTAAIKEEGKVSIFRVLILFSLTTVILIILWQYGSNNYDPFIKETLNRSGSTITGSDIFRMNCVGCHGITAQGLVGPDLHAVTSRLSDPKIINQVVKGLTPPMPSFEIDSQSMSDLLAYMHSLS